MPSNETANTDHCILLNYLPLKYVNLVQKYFFLLNFIIELFFLTNLQFKYSSSKYLMGISLINQILIEY